MKEHTTSVCGPCQYASNSARDAPARRRHSVNMRTPGDGSRSGHVRSYRTGRRSVARYAAAVNGSSEALSAKARTNASAPATAPCSLSAYSSTNAVKPPGAGVGIDAAGVLSVHAHSFAAASAARLTNAVAASADPSGLRHTTAIALNTTGTPLLLLRHLPCSETFLAG
ncbi:hypothetical protein ACU686_09685 [Yinghuangia aomiensis]